MGVGNIKLGGYHEQQQKNQYTGCGKGRFFNCILISIRRNVFGDSSFVPWSLVSIAGMELESYNKGVFRNQYDKIQEEVRRCGANVIKNKGATNYAIAMSVRHLTNSILKNTRGVLTVSSLMEGQYGIDDVCLSIPTVVGGEGIVHTLEPELTEAEQKQLLNSANILKEVIHTIQF